MVLRPLAVIAVVAWFGMSPPTPAQRLSPPSRTVFKCEVDGKVTYSDEACLGAKCLDVEPTRGLNKSSGQERVGADVRKERRNEQIRARRIAREVSPRPTSRCRRRDPETRGSSRCSAAGRATWGTRSRASRSTFASRGTSRGSSWATPESCACCASGARLTTCVRGTSASSLVAASLISSATWNLPMATIFQGPSNLGQLLFHAGSAVFPGQRQVYGNW